MKIPIKDAVLSYYLQSWLALNKPCLLFLSLGATCQQHQHTSQRSQARTDPPFPARHVSEHFIHTRNRKFWEEIRSLALGTGSGYPLTLMYLSLMTYLKFQLRSRW